jgi:aryl-alcohol dehydrogenase-like predicted oxidoreductase
VKYRMLGRSGLTISDIGYGAWGIGGTQWRGATDDEALRSLRKAFELGVNFVDTALAYGDGHSEMLTGRAVKEWGRPIVIATKVPPKNRQWPASPGSVLADVFPVTYVVECTEASLRNLGADAIDLQQMHVWNPRWTSQEEWRRVFEDLKRSGKVRHIGVSLTEHDPDSGLDLVRTGCVDAVQVIYNIFDPSAARNLFPLAKEFGVGVLARVPLDEGGLTGAITESTTFDPADFRAFYFRGKRKREVAERVVRLQQDLAPFPGSLPEIALRFCLSHPAVTSVIPGMRRIANVEANAAASDKEPLSAEILAVLARHAWPRSYYQ